MNIVQYIKKIKVANSYIYTRNDIQWWPEKYIPLIRNPIGTAC